MIIDLSKYSSVTLRNLVRSLSAENDSLRKKNEEQATALLHYQDIVGDLAIYEEIMEEKIANELASARKMESEMFSDWDKAHEERQTIQRVPVGQERMGLQDND